MNNVSALWGGLEKFQKSRYNKKEEKTRNGI
jgi:hypothetical protein